MHYVAKFHLKTHTVNANLICANEWEPLPFPSAAVNLIQQSEDLPRETFRVQI